MKRTIISVLVLYLLIFYLSCSKTNKMRLEGTWKMISGTYTDINTNQIITVDEEARFSMKIMCRQHFAVVEMYNERPDSLFFAAVGTYKLTPNKYIEQYDASNVGYQINTSREFDYTLEENRWIISTSDEDMKLHETWVKISQ